MSRLNPEKWDMQDGRVKFDTLLECGVTAASPFEIVMRLEYATSKQHMDGIRKGTRTPRRLQVAVNPDSAAKIADLLVKYSRRAKALPEKGKEKT